MGTKNKPGEFDCYDAAEDDEPMFVLLARDPASPDLVEAWARSRFRILATDVASGKTGDEGLTRGLRKIAEALVCARTMRDWRPKESDTLLPIRPLGRKDWGLELRGVSVGKPCTAPKCLCMFETDCPQAMRGQGE